MGKGGDRGRGKAQIPMTNDKWANLQVGDGRRGAVSAPSGEYRGWEKYTMGEDTGTRGDCRHLRRMPRFIGGIARCGTGQVGKSASLQVGGRV
jgi:hypothetical protein